MTENHCGAASISQFAFAGPLGTVNFTDPLQDGYVHVLSLRDSAARSGMLSNSYDPEVHPAQRHDRGWL